MNGRVVRQPVTRRVLRRVAVAVAVAMTAAAVVASGGSGASAVPRASWDQPTGRFHPGSLDLGDPLVPGYGNGGYDVSHYGITLAYGTTSRYLIGRTVITARLTQNLSRFNLDFVLPVRSVTVNGAAAAFKTIKEPVFDYGKELVVTPAKGLPQGSTMTVVVTYATYPFDDLVAKHLGLDSGRSPASRSGVTRTPRPSGEYPGNAYPSDKASYDIRVTTSKDVQVITNGLLVSRVVHGPGATTHWRETAPMASYLSFLNIGRYDVVTGPRARRDALPTAWPTRRPGRCMCNVPAVTCRSSPRSSACCRAGSAPTRSRWLARSCHRRSTARPSRPRPDPRSRRSSGRTT